MTMAEPKFTPGPWRAEFGYVFAGDDCIAICDTDNATPERYAANAQVMAAAKRMLEALRLAQEPVCSALCPSVKNTGEPWTHSEQCEAIRAAITAATSTPPTE